MSNTMLLGSIIQYQVQRSENPIESEIGDTSGLLEGS